MTKSQVWTAGFAYEQDFSNNFDLSIGMTYYEIDITNTVIAPSPGFIVGDCYGDEAGTGVVSSADVLFGISQIPPTPRSCSWTWGSSTRIRKPPGAGLQHLLPGYH